MRESNPTPAGDEPPMRGNPFVLPALLIVGALVLGGLLRSAIRAELAVGSEGAVPPGQIVLGPQPVWRTLPSLRSPWSCWLLGGTWHERRYKDDVGMRHSDARCLAEPGTTLDP